MKPKTHIKIIAKAILDGKEEFFTKNIGYSSYGCEHPKYLLIIKEMKEDARITLLYKMGKVACMDLISESYSKEFNNENSYELSLEYAAVSIPDYEI